MEKRKGKKDGDKKSKKKDKKRKCDDSSDSPAKPLFGGHEDDDDDKDDAAEQAKPKKKRAQKGARDKRPKAKASKDKKHKSGKQRGKKHEDEQVNVSQLKETPMSETMKALEQAEKAECEALAKKFVDLTTEDSAQDPASQQIKTTSPFAILRPQDSQDRQPDSASLEAGVVAGTLEPTNVPFVRQAQVTWR